ncbi:MAG TPA: flagellar biosynthesis protein FlhA, partial [Pirellulales bacterium]|nr:flagellar biosynthesis protein FlhA [Pirellulales bacterium]
GMPLGQASEVFTKLTIGDGLVSQVPAFLISLAAGLLVTRSSTETNLPTQFISQLFARPQALAVTCGFLGLLVFTSLPTLPLLVIGGSCAGLAISITRKARTAATTAATQDESSQTAAKAEARVEELLAVDAMEIEIGLGLIRLADAKRGGDLLDRVQRLRRTIAAEMGIIMPKVRIRDNLRLAQNQYRIKVLETVVATGQVQPTMSLAVDQGSATGRLVGEDGVDPVTGAAGVWIEPDRRQRAEMFGYRIVEPSTVIADHLSAVVKKHADELLTRDATRHLLDDLKARSPAVVDELVPGVMKLAEVQHVLQMLLAEGVPIRPLAAILEALGELAPKTKDPVQLVEHVRAKLARTISTRYRDAQGRMRVVVLDAALEERIRAGIDHNDRGWQVRLSPSAVETIYLGIREALGPSRRADGPHVVLVSPTIRAALKNITSSQMPDLAVLSYGELTRDTQVESMGVVTEASAT